MVSPAWMKPVMRFPAMRSTDSPARAPARALGCALLCACALLPLAAGARGGHGGGHGGHSGSGSAVSSSSSHGQSGAIRSVHSAASPRATSAGHGSNCASRDERGNCQGYNARAMESPGFGQSGTPISIP
jgi:hypothetical protein